MQDFDTIIKLVGLLGVGGVIGGIVSNYTKYFLLGESRQQKIRKGKIAEVDDNVKIIHKFGQQIMDLEVEILQLKRETREALQFYSCKDDIVETFSILQQKYTELHEVLKKLKVVSKAELSEIEDELSNIKILIESLNR